MDAKDFQEYLEKRYQDQVKWYDNKATINQKIYKRFQWLVIILSALTPVLIAVEDIFHWPAIVIAAIVAILTTALKTFRYQEHWLNYRTTCETLKKEKVFYDAHAGLYRDVEDKNITFIERVEALISQENTTWLSTAQQQRKEAVVQ
ncbi:DUF4231 domain-containing protein [candidate division KSB1 bacterium]|nr:DUF4231 domain-containing protein [candidate division KSB1 bacterium]